MMLRDAITWVAITALTLWFAASVARYLPRAERWITQHDVFFLVPQWNFFAPHPNRADYYLFYRTSHGEAVSPWREVAFPLTRRWYAGAWNPGRRNRKAFIDLCQAFGRATAQPREVTLLSVPYLLVLNLVSGLCADAPGERVQFAICSFAPSVDAEAPALVFLSEFHAV